MNISPVGLTSPYQSNLPTLNFDLNDMIQKAEKFAEGNENLLKYIKDILYDGKFQSNPKGYLEDWKDERGSSHQSIYPQDIAREFFDLHFKYDEESEWCTIQ